MFFINPVSANDINIHEIQHYFYYQQYPGTNYGLTGEVGYQYIRYIYPQAGVAIAVSGAASGRQGGYGSASLGGIVKFPINETIEIPIVLFFGSGGRKNIPAAGGLCINAQIGIDYNFFSNFGFAFRIGRLDYIQGDFKSNYIHIGIFHQFDEPFLR